MSEPRQNLKPIEQDTTKQHPLQRLRSPDPGLSAVVHVCYIPYKHETVRVLALTKQLY
jgi:hypothetical protein